MWLIECSLDNYLVQEEGDEYECASVLNSHTQDVKRVQWHPEKEVLYLLYKVE